MNKRWSIVGAATLAMSGAASVAIAAIFPDVPDGHVYQEPIEMLVGSQVINGNPDGSFYPDNPVNRAEMLKMLYKAKGKTPDPANVLCFKDVAPGSWYEAYVCDAAANRYVNGYADGTFKPGNPVNRVEALKMIATVFDYDVANITDSDREVVKFVDVSTAAWYTKYLYAAYQTGVLPIAGQSGSRFYPEWPLLRGEAAAYIYNALGVGLKIEREETEKQEEEKKAEEEKKQQNNNNGASSSTKTSAENISKNVVFPFNANGKFNEKATYSYLFDIAFTQVADVVVSLQSGAQGDITCRLYKVKENGFSEEYYLGYQEGQSCYITAALSAGAYQLQLQPSVANSTFTVSAARGPGDGNDGFIEALPLSKNVTRTEVLKGGNFANWYSFTVTSETKMTLEATNSQNMTCIIYSMSNVDLYGFTGPECNQSYTYPTGTYYVAIGRGAAKGSSQTYTIKLR